MQQILLAAPLFPSFHVVYFQQRRDDLILTARAVGADCVDDSEVDCPGEMPVSSPTDSFIHPATKLFHTLTRLAEPSYSSSRCSYRPVVDVQKWNVKEHRHGERPARRVKPVVDIRF